MFKPVNPRQNFPELEGELTKYWQANQIFEKSVSERPETDKYVFYDGPPFITGTPHYGTLLSRIAKDVVPRYWTMNGKRVERQWGWDCHGLPIENKVEKKLDIKNRRDIEAYGIQKFIDQCYTYTREVSSEWKWYKEKIGQWVDFDNSYKTMDQDYMETVIWIFKQLMDKGLVYEGMRTSLYCTRCGTPISNFEIAMDNSYSDMEDPAVTIKFPITSEGEYKGVNILAWTTTPWTLPSNKALVLDAEATYVLFTVEGDTAQYVAGKPLVDNLTDGTPYKVVKELKGKELIGLAYQPPFAFFPGNENEYKVYAFPGMANMSEGTGIVHSAPGFGDIDTQMGQANGINIDMTIDEEGKYFDTVGKYAGMFYKDADPIIMEDLQAAGKLFKSETIVHRFPYCYRCQTPLMQKAQPSWFVDIKAMRPDLVKNNEPINWVPDHLKDGRFKKGIEVAPDWGISRTRYWATPMPVWEKRDDTGKLVERVVIGSRDELREKSVQSITKVVFARHAERDKSDPQNEDGELNDVGKQQAAELTAKLAGEKFDAVYASPLKRAINTVVETAKNLKQEVTIDSAFSSLEDQNYCKTTIEKLKVEHKVEAAHDLPEEVLQTALKPLIDKARPKLLEFLKANQGKYVLAATHGERIAIIRHLFEGRSLKESLALDVPKGKTMVMYFNGTELLDLHRPKIDQITLKGESGELTRVREVLDVWMDSASMPYASKHYPFEDKKDFEANFPADFVVEYIAQTRAWFYVMHVISTALWNKPSFKNVVTTGVMFGSDGRKMSKSFGNYPDPKETLEKYGAEPLRLYLMSSRIMLGEDINFDEEGLKDQLRSFILPLWNCYSFFVTYANMHNWQPKAEYASNVRNPDPNNFVSEWDHIPFKELTNPLDQWIVARLQLASRDIRAGMEEYNLPAAVRQFPEFLNDLSKWYIRRSRDRFAQGDVEALSTLYYVLVEFIKLIAPVAPFLSEAIYLNLVHEQLKETQESIHLNDYPHSDFKYLEKSDSVLTQMLVVREIVATGQSLRAQHNLKVRQPLATIEVKVSTEPGKENELVDWMQNLIKDELNVKAVKETEAVTTAAGWLSMKSQDGKIEVALDTNLNDALKQEGIMRDLVRGIQNLRKKQGLQMGDKISLNLLSDNADVKAAIEANQEMLAKSVGADKVTFVTESGPDYQKLKLGSLEIQLQLNKI